MSQSRAWMEPIILPNSDARRSCMLLADLKRALSLIFWVVDVHDLHRDARPEIDCPAFGYLAWKGMKSTAIHQNPVTTLDLDPVLYPTQTGILRGTFCTREQLPAQEPSIDPDPSTINLAKTRVLSGKTFASVHQLTERICFPKSTVYHNLGTLFGSQQDIPVRFFTPCLKSKCRLRSKCQRFSWDRYVGPSTITGETLQCSAKAGSTIRPTTNQSGFLAMRKCQKGNKGWQFLQNWYWRLCRTQSGSTSSTFSKRGEIVFCVLPVSHHGSPIRYSPAIPVTPVPETRPLWG
jgi:hypothetical protein